jgi:hypothetical protein
MHTRRRLVVRSAVLFVVFSCSMAVADADQTYAVTGKDVFQIGGTDVRSEIAYNGTERLTIARDGANRRYVARVVYQRNDQTSQARNDGSFSSTVLPSGEQRDEANNDPDYLTVLNQPFAVQLDAATMHDLAQLHGSVPFDFPSPMTGAPLHGTLRHIADSTVNGHRVLGVAFDATGPLSGTLPDHPKMALSGSIRMIGTAYYTYGSALLLALDATLAIDGNLDDANRRDPVSIVYKRTIRATAASPAREARRAPE